MRYVFKNAKWEMLLYFGAVILLTLLSVYVGWLFYYHRWSETKWWLIVSSATAVLGLIVGYAAVTRMQRALDALQLGMLQITKNNLKAEIPDCSNDSFEPLFRSFNEMARTVERRTRKLQEMTEQPQRDLAEAHETAVKEERQRLARDLHDTVSQQLFAIHMAASSLPKILELQPEVGTDVMQQLISMSNKAQRQMRGLIAQLRPMELQGKSIERALEQWFPDYCRQNQLQGQLDIRLKQPMREHVELQLFFIIQESMANIVKHASALNVTLALHETGHRYTLTIVDDGSGFEVGELRAGSYGLSTIRERAAKLGGEAELMSKAGEGTRVRISIPIIKGEQE